MQAHVGRAPRQRLPRRSGAGRNQQQAQKFSSGCGGVYFVGALDWKAKAPTMFRDRALLASLVLAPISMPIRQPTHPPTCPPSCPTYP